MMRRSGLHTKHAPPHQHSGPCNCHDTLLERLLQQFKHMPLELRELIWEGYPMVRQRYFARDRYLSPADQPWSKVVRRGWSTGRS
jgi:hypothetical protein